MSSYQDVLKDMFNKHKGKYASKDLMRMASMEWNKMKGSKGKKMSGRGLPDDPAMLSGAGMPKKVRQPRVKSVEALGPSTEIPNFDSTGVSPYGEYQAKNAIKSLPANRIQVLKQLNFSGPKPTRGRGVDGLSDEQTKQLYIDEANQMKNNMGSSNFTGGNIFDDVDNRAYSNFYGGDFWDDVGSFFSSPDTWITAASMLL